MSRRSVPLLIGDVSGSTVVAADVRDRLDSGAVVLEKPPAVFPTVQLPPPSRGGRRP